MLGPNFYVFRQGNFHIPQFGMNLCSNLNGPLLRGEEVVIEIQDVFLEVSSPVSRQVAICSS